MSVRKIGPGRYQIRWREGTRHRQQTVRAPDRQAAVRAEQKILERRDLGTLDLVEAGKQTLGDYAEVWLGDQPNLGWHASRAYMSLLVAHLDSHTITTMRLCDLRASHLREWQRDRLTAGIKRAERTRKKAKDKSRAFPDGRVAIGKAGVLLGAVLDQAVADGLIPTNPATTLKRPRVERKPIRPLPPVEVEAIRLQMGLHDATLVSVLAYAGLRPEEALALTWGHIKDKIRIERVNVAGSIIAKTKTARGMRSVDILAPLAQDLAEYRMALGRPKDSALIFGPDLWTPTRYNNWRRRKFKKIAPAVKPYDLRHSLASLLIWEGRPVTYVAQQLGHSPAVCLSTYAHIMEGVEAGVSAEKLIREARGEPERKIANG